MKQLPDTAHLHNDRAVPAKDKYRVLRHVASDSVLYDIISTHSVFDDKEYLRLIDELGFGAYHPSLLTIG